MIPEALQLIRFSRQVPDARSSQTLMPNTCDRIRRSRLTVSRSALVRKALEITAPQVDLAVSRTMLPSASKITSFGRE